MKENKTPFPQKKQAGDAVLNRMKELRKDDARWQEGRVFSLVYYAGEEAYNVIKEATNLYLSENGLNPSVFPSLRRYETEVVSMACNLMNGDEQATGTITSGGTESIVMAIKTARTYAHANRPEVKSPEIIVPVSAHPAFDKACAYFDIKLIHAPLANDLRADVAAMERLITPNTIMIVGSAPAYPHGVLDPIPEIAALAQRKGLLCHVDACVGGFMLPFIERLGYAVRPFDFRNPGVTSISLDLHKYGYAAKGASLVLYRTPELRKHQFFVYTEWPGGIYASPSFAGTRPGGAIAAAWAIIQHLGMEGYLDIARRTMETTKRFQDGINAIPELYVISNPEMSVFAFSSDKVDIYAIGDEMTLRGWQMDRQQNPASLHITLNQIHCDYVEPFLADLREAVAAARKRKLARVGNWLMRGAIKGAGMILPKNVMSKLTAMSAGSGPDSATPKRTAAMYGMMGALPNRGDIQTLVIDFLDKLQSEMPEKKEEETEGEN